jgi:hypothetical protein
MVSGLGSGVGVAVGAGPGVIGMGRASPEGGAEGRASRSKVATWLDTAMAPPANSKAVSNPLLRMINLSSTVLAFFSRVRTTEGHRGSFPSQLCVTSW